MSGEKEKIVKNQMEDLFKRWIEDRKCWFNINFVKETSPNSNEKIGEIFVKDGIMNFEHYLDDNNPRILYIAKEAYTSSSEKGKKMSDLADDVKSGVKGLFWSRLAEWTYGIQNTTKSEIYDFNRIDGNKKDEALKRVAIINLKKSDGKTETNMEELKKYFDNNKYKSEYINYLNEQINIIKPKIIVCCGTYKIFQENFKDNISEENYKNNKRIYEFQLKNDKAFLIDYYHPSWQNSSELLYNTLMLNYQKTLK